jgi:hypothetical protein
MIRTGNSRGRESDTSFMSKAAVKVVMNNETKGRKPIVAVEWLSGLLRIREVPIRIFTRKPEYMTEIFVVFFSPPRQMRGQ